ncbi:unnamed protein product [Cuscuta europaea]|uniref:Uncharacterized protein n=1 Tax=Cuscuta europaea TaxID=41803 RepID=A0A9P0ZPC8_CUSEU|nr:unnamed protein product [Cuscuta europaea]
MRSPSRSAAVTVEGLLLFFEVARDKAAEDGSTPVEAGSAEPAARFEKSTTRGGQIYGFDDQICSRNGLICNGGQF